MSIYDVPNLLEVDPNTPAILTVSRCTLIFGRLQASMEIEAYFPEFGIETLFVNSPGGNKESRNEAPFLTIASPSSLLLVLPVYPNRRPVRFTQ